MIVLVGGRRGGGSGCEADTVVSGVEDRVEALTVKQVISFIPNKVFRYIQEWVTVDEVETTARVGTDIINDKVDAIAATTDVGVKGTGPDLGIGGEAVVNTTNVEVQGLQVGILRRGDHQEAGVVIHRRTSSNLVLLECI